jgi:hypothetical protein
LLAEAMATADAHSLKKVRRFNPGLSLIPTGLLVHLVAASAWLRALVSTGPARFTGHARPANPRARSSQPTRVVSSRPDHPGAALSVRI